jgi:hypothetical protein
MVKRVDSKILNIVIILLIVLVAVIYSIIGLKVYGPKRQISVPERENLIVKEDELDKGIDYSTFEELVEEINKKGASFSDIENKYLRLSGLLKTEPVLTTYCKEYTDYCLAFIQYLDQHPQGLEQEKVFVKHIKEFPQSINFLNKSSELRRHFREDTEAWIQFLQYLNEDPEMARQIYSSADVFDHVRRYPGVIKLFKEPGIRDYCSDNFASCNAFLRYLNRHPQIAKNLYNSLDVYEKIRELFFESSWQEE